METLKDFDESFGPPLSVVSPLSNPVLYPHGSRHPPWRVEARRPAQPQKLLLLLTDGKPNDVDHYEGRFALEDTRRAVSEARAKGVNVFAVTVDREANAYLPALFGHGGYALIGKLAKLPAALPAIYRMLAG